MHTLYHFIAELYRHTVASAPLSLNYTYKPDQSAVSAHFCNFHIKGGLFLKWLDQMCVFLGYMQINMHLL
jgi:hypothetical protein